MFRLLATRAAKPQILQRTTPPLISSSSPLSTAAATSAVTPPQIPSINDILVKLTFVDHLGARRIIPARIGQTVYDAAQRFDIDLGPSDCGSPTEATRSDTWTEPLFGEGTSTGYDMVVLGGNGSDAAESPMDHAEERLLDVYWDEDELYPESRLASQVVVTKEMDGMIVYVPDRLVDDVP